MAKDKTSVTLTERMINQLNELVKEIETPVSKNRTSLVNYYLYKIGNGDYDDLEPAKRDEKKIILVDKKMRQKAHEKAKEKGFKNVNEMLGAVIMSDAEKYLGEEDEADEQN